jgi:hypothetical protein
MSFKDSQMHVMAMIGACLLSAGLGVPTFILAGSADADPKPVIEDMEAIEASIAVRKTPAKQPQKKVQAPPPEVKPEGVSHQEDKVPDPKEKKPDPKDKPDPKFKVPDRTHFDDETPTGKPTEEVGAFNDNDRGFAEETKGDPFFQHVARDVSESWDFPKILDAKNAAVGCLRITAEGKIAKTKLDPKSGDDALDDSVERALKKVETLRNANPEAVPTHLLKQATTRWTCFKFNPQQRTE